MSRDEKPQYPLDALSNSDKILFALFQVDKKNNRVFTPLRHSQIVETVKKNASEETYQGYAKSSRTYYKKYKTLIEKQYLKKVKEKQTGNNYNAYVLTAKGEKYITQKIAQIRSLVEKSEESPHSGQSIPSASSPLKTQYPHHKKIRKSPRSPGSQQPSQQTLQTTLSNFSNSSQPDLSPTNNKNSKIGTDSTGQLPEITAQMLSSSVNSAKTIDLLLTNIQKLNQINENLQKRLNNDFIFDKNDIGRSSSLKQNYREKLNEDIDSELFDLEEDLTEEEFIINQSNAPSNGKTNHQTKFHSDISTSINNGKPNSRESKLFTSKLQSNIVNTKPKPQPPPPPKTPLELVEDLINTTFSSTTLQQNSVKNDLKLNELALLLEDDPKWAKIKTLQLSTNDRQQITIKILQQTGISHTNFGFLCQELQLSEQDIADLINKLENSDFPREQLQILGDRLINQIIIKTKTSRFALNDVIQIGEQQLNYELAIRNYLKNLFLNQNYSKALGILEQLKEITPHLDENYLILELKIHLNLRNYPKIEDIIKNENVLERSWKNDLIIFFAYRAFYEQQEYEKITGAKSNFPDKLKELAAAHYQILNDYDTILTPRKIHKIFTNLIPEFHSCPPNREAMIQFYLERLAEHKLPYYYFAIHFIHWVKNYEHNDPRIGSLLQAWWKGRNAHNNMIHTYFTVQEEIISEILNTTKINLEEAVLTQINQELRHFQGIREEFEHLLLKN